MSGDQKRQTGPEGKICNQNRISGRPEHTDLSADKGARLTRDNPGKGMDADHKGASANQQDRANCSTPRTGTMAAQLSVKPEQKRTQKRPPVYGALDLGTNNCRLLLARPNRSGFQIVDAFSRIIRLGEGVSETGKLSENAMERTIDALQICADKMQIHRVTRARLVATEACRAAANNQEFLERVKRRTGLELEIIDQETEATLALTGCVTLIDENCDYVLIFDIGGGSSELMWLDNKKLRSDAGNHYIGAERAILDWISIPLGVVTLAEKFGGVNVDQETFKAMIDYVRTRFDGFADEVTKALKSKDVKVHFLGTSGTVTTLAGVYLSQDIYDRQKIDGLWMNMKDVQTISKYLIKISYEQRQAIPTIGPDRADLVLGGCAILEAMLETWPTNKLRVADRGLREGILAKLMAEDGYIDHCQCWVSSPKRSKYRAGLAKKSRKRPS